MHLYGAIYRFNVEKHVSLKKNCNLFSHHHHHHHHPPPPPNPYYHYHYYFHVHVPSNKFFCFFPHLRSSDWDSQSRPFHPCVAGVYQEYTPQRLSWESSPSLSLNPTTEHKFVLNRDCTTCSYLHPLYSKQCLSGTCWSPMIPFFLC